MTFERNGKGGNVVPRGLIKDSERWSGGKGFGVGSRRLEENDGLEFACSTSDAGLWNELDSKEQIGKKEFPTTET